MSDDLVKRWDEYVESMGCVMGEVEHMAQQMRDRIEAQAAEIERLRGDLAKAGRDLNMARYGQPDFAWSIHKQAMADIEAKLENLLGGAETVLEAWDRGDEASFREAIEEMRADVEEAKGGKDE